MPIRAKKKHPQHQHLPWFDGLFVAALVAAFFSMLWFMINSTSFMLFGTIVTHVQTSQKVVALTFDDGPLPGTTEQTLAILANKQAKATFFVIGVEVKRHPDQLKEIIASGSEVGNHSYSHKYMAFMLPSDVKNEVENNDKLIRSLGYTGPIQFRTPYNAKLFTLPYYLMTHNRFDISRDVIPKEGWKRSSQQIADDVVSRVKPGSIILLHPMYDYTASSRGAIAPIIDRLRAEGYRFVTVSELLALRGK